jgi:AcrR family transcriptional regulator
MSPAATIAAADAPRAILEAADRLFYERGIAAVGMDDVRDAAGVSLRRLYGIYPSKRDLVAGWLDDRHVRWMQWFTDAIERRSAAGVEPLLATFDALAEWAESPGYRGCAFLNAIAETTEIDDTHRSIVAAHKRSLIDHITNLATRAHHDAPAWLAPALGVLLDGAIVQSAVFGTVQPITDARCAAAQLLESIR